LQIVDESKCFAIVKEGLGLKHTDSQGSVVITKES
jgi:hypothetical protein